MSAKPGLRSLMVIVAVSFALGFAGLAHSNLVTNGGFETGDFTGWVQFGNTDFNGVQCPGPGSSVAEGNCSAFFGPIDSIGGIEQDVSLVVGGSYVLSFYFMPDGGVPSLLSVSVGGLPLLFLANPAASAFQSFALTFVATAPIETLQFGFRDDAGFLLLDAISVRLAEPASMALLAIALVALFATVRRSAAINRFGEKRSAPR